MAGGSADRALPAEAAAVAGARRGGGGGRRERRDEECRAQGRGQTSGASHRSLLWPDPGVPARSDQSTGGSVVHGAPPQGRGRGPRRLGTSVGVAEWSRTPAGGLGGAGGGPIASSRWRRSRSTE